MNREILSVLHKDKIDAKQLFLSLPDQLRAHGIAVSNLVIDILRWAGVVDGENHEDLRTIREAVKYHDIGMLLIPERIRNKRDELTRAEFKIIENHTLYGSRLLDNHRTKLPCDEKEESLWRLAAEIALSHHERWDGRGYPNRQKTTTVVLIARATAIAGAFDNMVRGSNYRMPLPAEYALLEIIQNSGKQFDPMLTELIQENCDYILSGEMEKGDKPSKKAK